MLNKIIMKYAQKKMEKNGIVAVNASELQTLMNKVKSAEHDIHALAGWLDNEQYDKAKQIEEDLFYAVDYAEMALGRL